MTRRNRRRQTLSLCSSLSALQTRPHSNNNNNNSQRNVCADEIHAALLHRSSCQIHPRRRLRLRPHAPAIAVAQVARVGDAEGDAAQRQRARGVFFIFISFDLNFIQKKYSPIPWGPWFIVAGILGFGIPASCAFSGFVVVLCFQCGFLVFKFDILHDDVADDDADDGMNVGLTEFLDAGALSKRY